MENLISKIFTIPDRLINFFLRRWIGKFIRNNHSFGWLQAIVYSGAIDEWQRHFTVTEKVRRYGKLIKHILDVGGASGTILEFLNPSKYKITIVDTNDKSLTKIKDKRIQKIKGNGCDLPFEDNSFDVVISVDTLEHVPDFEKKKFCSELKRVTRKNVIIHCPVDSSDGKFQGTNYDKEFLGWYRKVFRKDEKNTLEHLSSGLPKVEDLSSLFPGALIVGKQNGDVWLKYMKQEMIPYVRLATGLFYKLFLSKKDDLPPYHACLMIWEK